jgi:uncharacterized membrane protein YhaH (DUF805 family)
MRSLFAFEGRIGRLRYALWSFGILLSQHLAVFALSGFQARKLVADPWFYIAPLRALVTLERASDAVLMLGLVWLLIAAWALAALSFRRAADADLTGWAAAYAIVPLVQIAVILLLCILPSRPTPEQEPANDDSGLPPRAWMAVAQGTLAGIAVTLGFVVFSALVLRTYGWGLFVLGPFFIGAATGFVANCRGDIGAQQNLHVVACATALGGFALLAAALEGVLCLVMAAPLALGIALIGGIFGRAVVASPPSSPAQTGTSLAVLPLVFALESVLGGSVSFDTIQSVIVRAAPDVVWRSIVHMDTIEEPLALPFRLGVAYPVRGEVIGEGVGALRRGEFSTGTAVERVTEWIPDRKLAFVVVEDVHSMRELSPYRHVHAPHAVGYFRTTSTSFELVPRPDGSTEVIEQTSHELKLEPALYWLPLVRRVVHQNNARVLAHVRRQAERIVRAGP